MTINSCLLCIGLNNYADKDIPRLSYSEADCYHLERAFNVFNIVDKSEFIFSNKVTAVEIYKYLTEFNLKIDNLFIYISGHGICINKTSYLYMYDTDLSNVENTALSLDLFFEFLCNLNVKKITVIIDACQIKLPRKINNKITIYYPRKKATFEDSSYKQSLFTRAIINYLSRKIHNNFSDKETLRYQRIRQSLFLFGQQKKMVYLYGKSGLGKSYFLRKIEENEINTYYVSIPKLEGVTYEIVLTLLSEHLALSQKHSYYNHSDTDPERFIQFYTNINPHCLIIIDHFERLDKKNGIKLLNFLNSIEILKIISSKSHYLELDTDKVFQFPELTKNDISDYIYYSKLDITKYSDNIYLHTNFIELLDYIYSKNNLANQSIITSLEINKIYKVVALCGGFVNMRHFSTFFKLDEGIIIELIDKGLIIEYESFFYPHDTIYDMKFNQIEFHELKEHACNYWRQEILSNFSVNKSLQSYLLLLKSFSFDINFNSEQTEFYIYLISLLKGRQNTYYLLLLYDYFIQKNIPISLAKLMCESLIEIGKFGEAYKLIDTSKKSSDELSALSIELYWWQGKFQECIDKATFHLKNSNLNVSLLCSRGIGEFFLGNWENALSDLNKVVDISSVSEIKEKYWSYCVIATMQGLRGTDFPSCVTNFIEAIKIAKTAGKLTWLAMIYGNIGEMLWKANFLDQALDILKIAKNLAYLTDNEALALEVNRNLIHAFHRNNNVSDALEIQNKLEKNLTDESDTYVKMQLINTFITHYIFNQNLQYKELLPQAIYLTKNNNEYYIYTLSNLAIIKLIETKNIKLASQLMEKALNLSLIGSNWLAIKQCLDDWDKVVVLNFSNQFYSQQVFQKWHQVLEKELLPYLHHLFDLCAFLQEH